MAVWETKYPKLTRFWFHLRSQSGEGLTEVNTLDETSSQYGGRWNKLHDWPYPQGLSTDSDPLERSEISTGN